MDKQKDGRSAFPMIESDTHGDGRVFHFSTGGMSERTLLAGMALTGQLASSGGLMLVLNDKNMAQNFAKAAFIFADAMIAEKEKQNDQL